MTTCYDIPGMKSFSGLKHPQELRPQASLVQSHSTFLNGVTSNREATPHLCESIIGLVENRASSKA
jgi:hypothetical protein